MPIHTIRRRLAHWVITALVVARPCWAQQPSAVPTRGTPSPVAVEHSRSADPVLDLLIREALASRPEIASSQANLLGERERVSQVGALPDPMLQVGIQNDGFTSIEVGKMPTSFYSIMASQTLPWPGKLGLQQEITRGQVKQSELALERVRLSTEAEVRRAYLLLLLARERLRIVDQLDRNWERSMGIAQAKYEAGQGILSDVLRIQVERHRLEQKRAALTGEGMLRVQQLNRMRARPLDETIDAATRLGETSPLEPEDELLSWQFARSHSPELAVARARAAEATQRVSLAKKSYYPDVTVSAGLMYRGTAMPPMWLLTVSGPVPIFSGAKQGRAVAESEHKLSGKVLEIEGFEQQLRLRVRQRQTASKALSQTLQIYRTGLLDQSALTVASTLDQYVVGKVGFSSVLDANVGYLADQENYLQVLADIEAIRIAAREVNWQDATGVSSPQSNTMATLIDTSDTRNAESGM